MTTHTFSTQLTWDGSTVAGYRAYGRSHHVTAGPVATRLHLSADPHFRGDAELLNPEQLLVAATSSCQLLSFLAEAARAGIDVRSYEDDATGTMEMAAAPQRIGAITLSPLIGVARGTDPDAVRAAVASAHEQCFIAHSLTSEVTVTPTVVQL
jgi:organic hydroperoxide reductase OsmC/OhrA